MNNRIKLIRKEAGLTQADFGLRIGLKQNSVAQMESAGRTPSNAVILSICKEFRINEEWLRTGEGEMHAAVSKKEQLALFFGEVMADDDESFRVRFFNALSEYNEDDWKVLEKLFSAYTRQPSEKEKEDV